MNFQEISAEQIARNPFELIGKNWMLITAEKDGQANTMTASWGGVGILWGKPVAYVFIRPQRYTREFVDAADSFSLSFLPEKFRKELSYLGSTSGRDEDKIKKAGLTAVHEADVPYFDEADLVLICKKLYRQEQTENCYLDRSCIDRWSPNKDFHIMYIAEITKVLKK